MGTSPQTKAAQERIQKVFVAARSWEVHRAADLTAGGRPCSSGNGCAAASASSGGRAQKRPGNKTLTLSLALSAAFLGSGFETLQATGIVNGDFEEPGPCGGNRPTLEGWDNISVDTNRFWDQPYAYDPKGENAGAAHIGDNPQTDRNHADSRGTGIGQKFRCGDDDADRFCRISFRSGSGPGFVHVVRGDQDLAFHRIPAEEGLNAHHFFVRGCWREVWVYFYVFGERTELILDDVDCECADRRGEDDLHSAGRDEPLRPEDGDPFPPVVDVDLNGNGIPDECEAGEQYIDLAPLSIAIAPSLSGTVSVAVEYSARVSSPQPIGDLLTAVEVSVNGAAARTARLLVDLPEEAGVCYFSAYPACDGSCPFGVPCRPASPPLRICYCDFFARVDGVEVEAVPGDAVTVRFDPRDALEEFDELNNELTGIVPESLPPAARCDANGDGEQDISDPIFILGYLFLGQPAPRCIDAADCNDDGIVDLSDVIFALRHRFGGGPPPPAPFPGCGPDPTPDTLGCDGYFAC